MTIDDLVFEIQLEGLSVNNLFQLEDGSWRANLRGWPNEKHTEYFHEFATGPGPTEALEEAFEKAKSVREGVKKYQATKDT